MNYMLTGNENANLTQQEQIKLLGERCAVSGLWGDKNYDVSNVKTIIDRYLTHLNTNYDEISKYVQAVSDNNTNQGWLNLEYEPKINHEPIANPDKGVSGVSGSFFDKESILANDTDVDGDHLGIIGATALHGKAVVTKDGIQYTPDAGYAGTDTVEYYITDGYSRYATGKIDVTVTGDGETATQPTAPNLDVRLVSSNSSGVIGNNTSSNSSISSDGRYVTFESYASNLVDGDTNGRSDIFLKDTDTGAIKLVSSNSSGVIGNSASYHPSISSDGRYVAFDSASANLADGDTYGKTDIFLKDTKTGAIELISSSLAGNNPLISSDGRYVLFQVQDHVYEGGDNVAESIFMKDTVTGSLKNISTSSSGAIGNMGSDNPSISSDGRYVAFDSGSTNFVDGDTNSGIFIKDTDTGAIKLSSAGGSDPFISSDGRHVVFASTATNLVDGDTNRSYDVFLKDTHTETIKLVSSNSSGVIGNAFSGNPSISSDGRYVAFYSDASNLVDGDTNNSPDIFVKDTYTGNIKLISKNSNGVIGNNYSHTPSISSDGRYISFFSSASNLVDGDTNSIEDIFIVGNPLYDSSIV